MRHWGSILQVILSSQCLLRIKSWQVLRHLLVRLLTDERQTVQVTGASGFVGSHMVDQLLRAGYAVRG